MIMINKQSDDSSAGRSAQRKRRSSRLTPGRGDSSHHHHQATFIESTTAQASPKRRRRHKKSSADEEDRVMDQLPWSYKCMFGSIGFAKWGKTQWPSLIVNPFMMDQGALPRKEWCKLFEKRKHRADSKESLPFLVRWYGHENQPYYNVVPQSNFLALRDAENYLQKFSNVANSLREKEKNGSLSSDMRLKVDAMEEMQYDLDHYCDDQYGKVTDFTWRSPPSSKESPRTKTRQTSSDDSDSIESTRVGRDDPTQQSKAAPLCTTVEGNDEMQQLKLLKKADAAHPGADNALTLPEECSKAAVTPPESHAKRAAVGERQAEAGQNIATKNKMMRHPHLSDNEWQELCRRYVEEFNGTQAGFLRRVLTLNNHTERKFSSQLKIYRECHGIIKPSKGGSIQKVDGNGLSTSLGSHEEGLAITKRHNQWEAFPHRETSSQKEETSETSAMSAMSIGERKVFASLHSTKKMGRPRMSNDEWQELCRRYVEEFDGTQAGFLRRVLTLNNHTERKFSSQLKIYRESHGIVKPSKGGSIQKVDGNGLSTSLGSHEKTLHAKEQRKKGKAYPRKECSSQKGQSNKTGGMSVMEIKDHLKSFCDVEGGRMVDLSFRSERSRPIVDERSSPFLLCSSILQI